MHTYSGKHLGSGLHYSEFTKVCVFEVKYLLNHSVIPFKATGGILIPHYHASCVFWS